MSFSDDLLMKVNNQINQILLSSLTMAQCLNAIKKLIIPKLDFIFMNGVISWRDVGYLDENIRGLLQRKLNCSGLPIDTVHDHWKDGGLNIPRLVDRFEALQLTNIWSVIYQSHLKKDFRARSLSSIKN